jgi:Xaa-Pro aminopeptidase
LAVQGVFKEGHVFTNEPGLYFPSKWGVRLEDLLVCRGDRVEVLTRLEKELEV